MVERTTSDKKISFETSLYGLALALALAVRLFRLGTPPLTDFEARWALQALEVARGGVTTVSSQPLYVLLTGLLFSLIKESNTLARLLPALAGSGMVLLPLLFNRVTKQAPWTRNAGLILAFALALDPALAALSRQAGSPVLALSFGTLAASFAFYRKHKLVGLFAGLALLSGPGLVQGVLGFGLAWLLAILARQAGLLDLPGLLFEDETQAPPARALSLTLAWGVGTVLVAGTLLLRLPQGLAGLADTLQVYLQGWTAPSGIPALRLPAALLAYQPLAVIFGLIGALRGWIYLKRPSPIANLARFLSLWGLAALVLCLVYPGRQVYDATWVLLPLWGLAALELARALPTEEERVYVPSALGMGALMALFLFMIWYNLLRLGLLQATKLLYLAVVGGVALIALTVIILVAAGWSTSVARLGLAWGASLTLGVYMLSALWGLTQLRPNSPAELWSTGPGAGQVDLLMETLDQFSSRERGLRDTLDIAVTVDSSALRWVLRDYASTRFTNLIARDEQPSIIVTPQEQQAPNLVAGYRGQDFFWRIFPGWSGTIPPNWLRWLTFREAPAAHDQVILWVRSDLFLDWEGTGLEKPTQP